MHWTQSPRLTALIVFATIIAGVMPFHNTFAAEAHPCWIWGASNQAKNNAVRLNRSFQTSSTASSVNLRFVTCYANATILLDGQVIASAEGHDPILEVEVDHKLRAGDHEVVIEATGATGPSAIFLCLNVEFADSTRQSIVSNSKWKAENAPANNLGPVDRRLIVPDGRRVGINAVDNYEQWKQALDANQGTDPVSFQIAPGFEIRLIRSALPEEDSWVSLEFDPQGRVIIAKEQKGLLRMTLSSDGNEVANTELIDEGLEECRGLAFVGDDLYANANNSKGLYRLRSDGDRFAEPELLRSSTGGVGHGRNDLAVGPDGKLYSIHGDSVDLPDDAVDYTSPFRNARHGKRTSEGHLLRIDPMSGDAELLAAGLRNPFGVDFNADGDCFTYDADAEHDMGSPWYRPTRVSHLVIGGDYGWRGVTKSWPSYYPDHPDNARPNLDIGKGSPTAVKFGTQSNFPAPYRDALFILDWAYGRIIAVHMIPRGASYLMTAETFLKGRPLNVTDLGFAPNGSMYFVTGGRKTQSALYRIRSIGDSKPHHVTATPHQEASDRFAKASRQIRRELEADLSKPPSEDAVARAWAYLSNPDPWIRHAAVNVVERNPTSMWQSRALVETELKPALHALTALARSKRPDVSAIVLNRLNEILPQLDSSTDRLAAFYAYWLCLHSIKDLEVDLRVVTAAKLSTQYPSGSYREPNYAHNRLLSEMLVKLGSTDAVAKTISLLRTAKNQTEQMHYLYVLRNARDGWSIAHRQEFFSALAQASHYLGGAGMPGFLKKIRDEAIETLSDDERQQLGPLLQEEPPSKELVATEPRSLVRNWTVEELLSTEGDQHQANLSRGAKVFAAASCMHCHRFGTRGTLIGPDLTSVSRRFSRRDLLASIIEPSKVIAEDYRSLQIVTTGGKTYVGQVTGGGDFRSPVLRLSPDPAQPFSTVEIPKTEIESQEFSKVSWMPKGLLDTFTRGEILDLLAYLDSAP